MMVPTGPPGRPLRAWPMFPTPWQRSPDGEQPHRADFAGPSNCRGTGGSAWARLATLRSLAAAAAGRACRLTGFTAAAFSPGGAPLVAGACAGPGVAGIFAKPGEDWQAAGPALPASLAGQPVTVLRLSTAGWARDGPAGRRQQGRQPPCWPHGPARLRPLGTVPISPNAGQHVLSASFGPGGSVGLVLSGRRGETLTGPGGSWQQLPALPAGTQALVLGHRAAGRGAGRAPVGDDRVDAAARPAGMGQGTGHQRPRSSTAPPADMGIRRNLMLCLLACAVSVLRRGLWDGPRVRPARARSTSFGPAGCPGPAGCSPTARASPCTSTCPTTRGARGARAVRARTGRR